MEINPRSVWILLALADAASWGALLGLFGAPAIAVGACALVVAATVLAAGALCAAAGREQNEESL